MFRLIDNLFVVCIFVLDPVLSLRLEGTAEGSCFGTHFPPLPITDWTFAQQFNFISAGSRATLYSIASGHPRFGQMREYELYYNLCSRHNGTIPKGQVSTIGFDNVVLGTYTWFQTQPGIIANIKFSMDADGGNDVPIIGQGTHTVTLTDYKTFIFLANCWTFQSFNGTQQKNWEVMSITPNLSAATKERIEEHAISLGFNRDEFIFLNYRSCSGENVNSGGVDQFRSEKFDI